MVKGYIAMIEYYLSLYLSRGGASSIVDFIYLSKENKTALTNIDNESKEITKILNNSPINELDLINKIYSINKILI